MRELGKQKKNNNKLMKLDLQEKASSEMKFERIHHHFNLFKFYTISTHVE